MNLTVLKSLMVTGALALAGGTTAFIATDAAVAVPATVTLSADGNALQLTAGEALEHGRPGNALGLSEEARTFLMDGIRETTANALGVSVEELEAAGREGLAELLATAGLTQEELRTAVEEAWPGIVSEAEAAGLITAEQAATLLETGPRLGGRGGHGPGGRGGAGVGAGFLPAETRDEIAAASLGITVAELEAYQAEGLHISEIAAQLGLEMADVRAAAQEATIAAVEQAVVDGTITQEQADAFLARLALQEVAQSINQQALLQALGITAAELQAYKDEGLNMADIIIELGLDPEAVRAEAQTAREALIQQAIDDGTLTAEQGEQLLNGRGGSGGFGGGQGRRGPGSFDGTNQNAPVTADSNA